MRPSRIAAVLLASALIMAACSASDPPAVESEGDGGSGTSGGATGTSGGATGTSGASSGSFDSGPPVPTATDGVKNGDETDIDCGGATAPACAATKGCSDAHDCSSLVCASGLCAAPTHKDDVKNGDETGKDCGGATAPRCLPGASCLAQADCAEKVCTSGLCAEPTHEDGVKNGDETGKDCGGDAPETCDPGEGCADSEDCTEKICLLEVCAAPTALDEVKNGDETDVDCGGTSGRLCPVTKACLVGGDCAEKVCGPDGNRVCLAPTFQDQVKNGKETGKDCGGPDATSAERCATGEGCVNDQGARDCQSKVCQNALCQAPSFTDEVQNGNETGKDCGGPTAPNRCPEGQGCGAGSDCTEKVCGPEGNRVCLAPTFQDQVKNGTETDLDCGGAAALTVAERCAATKICASDSDCASDGCAYNLRCADARSCTPMLGGATCGGGEVVIAGGVTTPGAAHESCCTSIPVPGQNIRLDKYEITAGRMREFLRRMPNIRTWVDSAANPVPQLSSFGGYDLRKYLSDAVGQPYHPRMHVGPSVFQSGQPSVSQGCFLGAPNTNGYGGHNTYWFNKDDQAAIGGAAERMFTQPQLDTKSLTCSTYVILAAFCAWDGGFLPTAAQTRAAWGANAYPWGTARYDNTTVLDNGQRRTNWNPGLDNTYAVAYKYPTHANFDYGQYDQAFVIASPGRMLNDVATVGGWRDLAANVFEITASKSGDYNDGEPGRGNMPRVTWLGGSFEGHYGSRDDGGYQYPILTKYGKTGGRCARPL